MPVDNGKPISYNPLDAILYCRTTCSCPGQRNTWENDYARHIALSLSKVFLRRYEKILVFIISGAMVREGRVTSWLDSSLPPHYSIDTCIVVTCNDKLACMATGRNKWGKRLTYYAIVTIIKPFAHAWSFLPYAAPHHSCWNPRNEYVIDVLEGDVELVAKDIRRYCIVKK